MAILRCDACDDTFEDAKQQKVHSQWHRENLKRKVRVDPSYQNPHPKLNLNYVQA
ncbi:hypothetical protein QJS10_CPB17g00036 [Acorus calamus]|uniref:C2H2-type domain-containing protein n=1 Tax=Acorus calamus TaxID=4465 RepID=A0AAV9CSH7_ACOCL|nr:hypothetical protein QJS10_CPB17g00036 [Acorus calamus]